MISGDFQNVQSDLGMDVLITVQAQAPVGSSVGLNSDIWERKAFECRAFLQTDLHMGVSHHGMLRAWNFSHRVLVVSHHEV